MKIRFGFSGVGDETVIGTVSAEIAEHIRECYGDAVDDYFTSIANNEVPEGMALYDPSSDIFDCDDILHRCKPWSGSGLIEVIDENDNPVYCVNADEESLEDAGIDTQPSFEYILENKRPDYMVIHVEELKGFWDTDLIEINDDNFDPKRLTICTKAHIYLEDDIDYLQTVITGFIYDGIHFDLFAEESRGKAAYTKIVDLKKAYGVED